MGKVILISAAFDFLLFVAYFICGRFMTKKNKALTLFILFTVRVFYASFVTIYTCILEGEFQYTYTFVVMIWVFNSIIQHKTYLMIVETESIIKLINEENEKLENNTSTK